MRMGAFLRKETSFCGWQDWLLSPGVSLQADPIDVRFTQPGLQQISLSVAVPVFSPVTLGDSLGESH